MWPADNSVRAMVLLQDCLDVWLQVMEERLALVIPERVRLKYRVMEFFHPREGRSRWQLCHQLSDQNTLGYLRQWKREINDQEAES